MFFDIYIEVEVLLYHNQFLSVVKVQTSTSSTRKYLCQAVKKHVDIEFSTSYIRNCIPELTMVIAAAAYVYCISFLCLITYVDEQLILPIYLHKCPISYVNRINACAKQTLVITFFTCSLKLWSLA